MSHPGFFARTEIRPPHHAVWWLEGSLFGTPEAHAFQDQAREQVNRGAKKIVLEMSGVQKIDSCGIGILAAVLASLQKAGGQLVLVGMNPSVHKLLDFIWFLKMAAQADSLDEALK